MHGIITIFGEEKKKLYGNETTSNKQTKKPQTVIISEASIIAKRREKHL